MIEIRVGLGVFVENQFSRWVPVAQLGHDRVQQISKSWSPVRSAPSGMTLGPISRLDRTELDFALVRFEGRSSATETFVAARDGSGADAPWTRQVGFVEHHHNGHLVLRGTFAGHYIDVEEPLQVSERGAGLAGGAVVGVLLGPAGLAVGMVAGATIGSQVGESSEIDFEPQLLVDQLRAAVPRSGSAIVLIAPVRDVDQMLTAIGDSGGEVIRQTLTADQAAALEASLSATPAASLGPSEEGEQAAEASEPEKT